MHCAFTLVLELKLYLITTVEGMPVAWCLADPKLGEREVATELFAHACDIGALRAKLVVLADKGLAGREIERFCADRGPGKSCGTMLLLLSADKGCPVSAAARTQSTRAIPCR
ncbi:hypothetical protein [Nocardia testacea]|uniref:hypothetical protein n=1 Tax=Nocardia testacea TaxID=248551 RepID=UPI003A884DF3